MPQNKSIILPPSACGTCGHRLNYMDMVPVVNYLMNRGKCRYCGSKYSIQYPLIELLNGLVYGAIALKHGLSVTGVVYCITVSTLITLSIIDVKHKTIPDSLNIVLAGLGLLFIICDSSIINDRLYRLLGALTGFILFLVIALVSKAMGGGDIKLIAALGLIFGFKGILFIAFFSFVIGGATSLVLLITKIKTRKDEIPFGPFISAGALLYIFYGQEIIDLYLSFIRLDIY